MESTTTFRIVYPGPSGRISHYLGRQLRRRSATLQSYLAPSLLQNRGWSTAQLAEMVLGVYVRLGHDVSYLVGSGLEFSVLENRRDGPIGTGFHRCRWGGGGGGGGKEVVLVLLYRICIRRQPQPRHTFAQVPASRGPTKLGRNLRTVRQRARYLSTCTCTILCEDPPRFLNGTEKSGCCSM